MLRKRLAQFLHALRFGYLPDEHPVREGRCLAFFEIAVFVRLFFWLDTCDFAEFLERLFREHQARERSLLLLCRNRDGWNVFEVIPEGVARALAAVAGMPERDRVAQAQVRVASSGTVRDDVDAVLGLDADSSARTFEVAELTDLPSGKVQFHWESPSLACVDGSFWPTSRLASRQSYGPHRHGLPRKGKTNLHDLS